MRCRSRVTSCHADIPSAPTLMTDCQGRFGALVSFALDCCEEFVCATQMYGDIDATTTVGLGPLPVQLTVDAYAAPVATTTVGFGPLPVQLTVSRC